MDELITKFSSGNYEEILNYFPIEQPSSDSEFSMCLEYAKCCVFYSLNLFAGAISICTHHPHILHFQHLQAESLIGLEKYQQAIQHIQQLKTTLKYCSLLDLIRKPADKNWLLCRSFHALANPEKCIESALKIAVSPLPYQIEKYLNFYWIVPSLDQTSSDIKLAWQLNLEFKFADSQNILKPCSRSLFFPEDPAIPLIISNYYHQADRISLYRVANWLYQNHPKGKSCWPNICVAAYYMASSDSQVSLTQSSPNNELMEKAKKYLCKATLSDRLNPYAWEGFATSFSITCDYDQSIAAYSTLSKLVPKSPVPWMMIGAEYVRSGNWILGERYLKQAMLQCEENVFSGYKIYILNELGCLDFRKGEFSQAIHWWKSSLSKCNSYNNMTIRTNLGYGLLMIGEFKEALAMFEETSNSFALAIGKMMNLMEEEALSLLHCLSSSNNDKSSDEREDLINFLLDSI